MLSADLALTRAIAKIKPPHHEDLRWRGAKVVERVEAAVDRRLKDEIEVLGPGYIEPRAACGGRRERAGVVRIVTPATTAGGGDELSRSARCR